MMTTCRLLLACALLAPSALSAQRLTTFASAPDPAFDASTARPTVNQEARGDHRVPGMVVGAIVFGLAGALLAGGEVCAVNSPGTPGTVDSSCDDSRVLHYAIGGTFIGGALGYFVGRAMPRRTSAGPDAP